MSPKLREYMRQIEKETGVTYILQRVLYEKYGYVLKKVGNINGEMQKVSDSNEKREIKCQVCF